MEEEIMNFIKKLEENESEKLYNTVRSIFDNKNDKRLLTIGETPIKNMNGLYRRVHIVRITHPAVADRAYREMLKMFINVLGPNAVVDYFLSREGYVEDSDMWTCMKSYADKVK